MTDLDAIRARDAGLVIERHPNATVAHISVHDGDCLQSALDRRALLAEVDRLETALEREMDAGNTMLAEVDRLRGDNAVLSDAMVDRNIDRWDRGVAAERARALPVIEAARLRRNVFLTGQPGFTDGEWVAVPHSDFTALRAALARYEEVGR